jgi:hypothetical protein
MEHGAWSKVQGARSKVQGARSKVQSARNKEHGAWGMGHGARSKDQGTWVRGLAACQAQCDCSRKATDIDMWLDFCKLHHIKK